MWAGSSVALGATFAYSADNGSMRVMLRPSEVGLACDVLYPTANAESLWFDVPATATAGTSLDAAGAVMFQRSDMTCGSRTVVAVEGSVVVSGVGSKLEGTIDVKLADGRLKGTFEATPCAAMPTFAQYCL